MIDRMSRINQSIRSALSELLSSSISDPRLRRGAVVSICSVQTSADLRCARVRISVVGPPDAQQEALAGLQSARSFLRRSLAQYVRTRNIPELVFVLDNANEEALKIDQVLREIRGAGRQQRATLAEISTVLEESTRILVTTHPEPDGDAVGSALAVFHQLVQRGKDVVIYNPHRFIPDFAFLSGADVALSELPENRFDATVVVDCSDRRMFREHLPERDWLGTVLVLDHHQTIGDIGDLIYCDSGAAACGVIIYRLIREMKDEINLSSAEAIYTAIVSDTGAFRYSNTDEEALAIAAELVGLGVDPRRIASELYEGWTTQKVGLLAEVLRSLEVDASGRVAVMTVSRELLERTGCAPRTVSGFVNYARGLVGVEVGVLLQARGDGWRVSLRSRGAVDVANMASGWGGGGHRHAAGFTWADEDCNILVREIVAKVDAEYLGGMHVPGDRHALG